MSDYLQETAQNFENALNNSYEIAVGNRKKQVTFLIPTVSCEEFTHITGLDHLSDISALEAVNIKQKLAIYKNILINQITYNDISKSQFINSPITNSYNFKTKSEYTINDRILSLINFEYIMDNIYKGKVYKWNLSNCNIKKPNGKYRRCSVEADYLITIPGNFDKETIYLFAYQTNKEQKKSEPIILNIFSAFPDGVDLTRGQDRPYTILEEKKNGETIFTHPAYKKDQFSQSTPKANNVMKIQFDNPMPKNITVNSSGAIAAVPPAPSFFSSIFERIKQTFSNLFKPQDKPAAEIAEPAPEEKAAPELPKSIDKPYVSESLTAFVNARNAFAAGNLSLSEYENACKDYMRNLNGKEMWTEAIDNLRQQLDQAPLDMKKYILIELKNFERIFERKFAPKPQQTLAEIKIAAQKKYIELQNEKKAAEKEKDTVTTHDRYER